jgi:hypothetical protein
VRTWPTPPGTPEHRLFDRLILEADLALQRGPHSVTDKTEFAPSGDRQDYYPPGALLVAEPRHTERLSPVSSATGSGFRAPGFTNPKATATTARACN